jgi:hypothetical protein
MFVRNDGLMTDTKASARLFETFDEAKRYILEEWLSDGGVHFPENREAIEIVRVETKQVMHKVLEVELKL